MGEPITLDMEPIINCVGYTVYYHGACATFTGRATPIMWLLEQAKKEYSCETPDKFEGNCFAPPMIATPTGLKMSQTAAIMMQLGEELGMEPETPAAKATAIQLSLDAADLFAEAFSGAFAEKTERAEQWLTHMDKLLSTAGGDFMVGSTMCYADFSATLALDFVAGAIPKTIKKFPKLIAYLEKMHATDGWKAVAAKGVPMVPAGTGVNCCDAFPDGYKDITPKEGLPSADYLAGCKLVHMPLRPGQKDEPHEHPKHYAYVVKGGKLKIVGAPAPDGEATEVEFAAGAAMVMPAGVHQVENVGDAEVELLFLEVGAQAGDTPEGHVAPQETDASHYSVLAEDDDWMVVKMDVKAGEEDHAHSHREHIVYALSEAELSIWGGADKDMIAEGEPNVKVPIKPGMVLPVPTGFHIVKNTGQTDASCVYFERKR